jgi:hypothetical protein
MSGGDVPFVIRVASVVEITAWRPICQGTCGKSCDTTADSHVNLILPSMPFNP